MLAEEGAADHSRREWGRACCLLLFIVILLGGMVSYAVFIVYFLIKDRDICGGNSPVWTYVVMSLIISVLMSRTNKATVDDNGNDVQPSPRRKLMYTMSAPVVNVVYGTIVIHVNHVCGDMKKSGLWIIAQFIYYSSIFIVAVIMVMLQYMNLRLPATTDDGEVQVALFNLQNLLSAVEAQAFATALPQADATPVVCDAVVATDVRAADGVIVDEDETRFAHATAV